MTYRSIMVCLDDSARSQDRLDLALKLALRHEAHLTAVHLAYLPVTSSFMQDDTAPLLEKLEEELAARRQRARRAFEDAAARADVRSAWATARNHELDAVAALARGSDLVIAGQRDQLDPATYVGEGFPDRFLLETARPVLMVPAVGTLNAGFERIVVAWNGSREAARAVADALPFLIAAEQVTVVTVMRGAARRESPRAVPAPDIAAFLRRHGVRTSVLEDPGSDDPAQWLLARTQEDDLQTDLIVAGAYGHSRLSEFILGGVTRTLLTEMTVPVLMSH